ncbi:hypothetical protein ABZ402_32410 [Streptomyces mirabilis]|uniref:hypothetical protein n=1 Tax=Streptomyces mirabilis TaxID=68239 RepID=UPI0033D11372
MTGRAGKFVALTWDDAGLSDLHAQPAHEMPGRVTAFAIEEELQAAAAAFAVPAEPDEPAELRLRGFPLLDQATCRLYLDTPTARDTPPIGIDLPLRDDEGSVVVGVTGTHAVLPILLETGELERMRKNADDPYCRAVYDLADWLTGR